jgi:hypothetical protein
MRMHVTAPAPAPHVVREVVDHIATSAGCSWGAAPPSTSGAPAPRRPAALISSRSASPGLLLHLFCNRPSLGTMASKATRSSNRGPSTQQRQRFKRPIRRTTQGWVTPVIENSAYWRGRFLTVGARQRAPVDHDSLTASSAPGSRAGPMSSSAGHELSSASTRTRGIDPARAIGSRWSARAFTLSQTDLSGSYADTVLEESPQVSGLVGREGFEPST